MREISISEVPENIQAVLKPCVTPQQVAEAWGVSGDTVRRIFQDRPGVIKLKSPRLRGKRPYTLLRIPIDIVEQVQREISK